MRIIKKKTLYLGLIGGILVLIGTFTDWTSSTAGGITSRITGYDFLSADRWWPAIATLVGGVLALLGGIGLLAAKRIVGVLFPIGGTLAIVGAFYATIRVAQMALITIGLGGATRVSVGYGILLCFIGGALALIGTFSLRSK